MRVAGATRVEVSEPRDPETIPIPSLYDNQASYHIVSLLNANAAALRRHQLYTACFSILS
jgi:hypothetical protein